MSCNHPKRERLDEKMPILAVLKVEIEDAPVVSKISQDFCCFLEEMPEYRVFLKVESEDAPVMLTQYYRCVFITCTLKQMFEKSNGMHPCFERNSRFWGLNHVVLSLFRRTYVQSLSLHFLKEKECVFASFREIISICSEKVKKFEVKKVFSIFAKIKI